MATEYPDDAYGNALRRVAVCGSDMSQPMDIDFFIVPSDEATAKRIADEAGKLGYRTEICFDDDHDASEHPWTCACTKSMVPAYPSVIAAQAELDAIARSLGAYTDGWGTVGGGEHYTMSGFESQPATPKPARPRFQYSLRSLFAVTTAFAVIMAIIVTPTRTQRVAREIEKMHGLYRVTEIGPTWIRRMFGRTIKDSEYGRDSTFVGPLDSLESVDLGFLRRPCDVHDEWLVNLAGQTSLQDLYLSGTGATDNGIVRLRNLPKLRRLNMSRLPITDWSLAPIAAFTNLETLVLSQTPISGRTIFALKTLPRLKELDLDDTEVDDAAIADLKDLQSLERLDLTGTNVTRKGVDELQSALPKCHISYWPRSTR